MAENITIEIDSKYREHLDLLKQIFPNESGEEISSDTEIIGALIDSFMAFIQEQANAHNHEHEEGGCCGGEGKSEGHGGCGCSH